MTEVQRRSTLVGMALAVAGFMSLSIGDSVVKTMSDEFPAPALAGIRFIFGMMITASLLVWKEGRAALVWHGSPIQYGRGASVAIGSMLFFTSLSLMPLGEATAVTFVSPILVALFAPALLGEKVTPAIWIATIIAFAGVLIVTRPSPDHLGLAALLPLGTAFFTALIIILNRMVAGQGSALQMQWLLALTATPIVLITALAGHFLGVETMQIPVPDWTIVARCFIVAITATTAHALIYMATERLEAAHFSPFAYVQLVGSIMLGAMLFDEHPDLLVLIGCVMIVGSGLMLWRAQLREAARARS